MKRLGFSPRGGLWMNRFALVPAALLLMFLTAACATSVKRVDSETVTDLSGYWNDTDVRIVCDSLIKACLDSPRVIQDSGRLSKNPVF
ncbi:MAG: hypothetical protein LBB77_10665, partial [Treponema sp.]|nr:hypothetical protein [Treponema sp.]